AGLPSGRVQLLVFFGENARDNFARVPPFIKDLVENAGIGMLSGEAEAQQLDAHTGDFIDQAGNIRKPPAAKDMQIPELAGENAEFVLIFPRKDGAKEFVLRVCIQDVL